MELPSSKYGSGLLQCKEDIWFRVPHAPFANIIYTYIYLWAPFSGETCPHYPLIFSDFTPCSPSTKPLVPLCQAQVPLIPKTFVTLLTFVCLFHLLFIAEEITIIILVSSLVFSWSQESNQKFPCSQKIIWQYHMFPQIKSMLVFRCSLKPFPLPPLANNNKRKAVNKYIVKKLWSFICETMPHDLIYNI